MLRKHLEGIAALLALCAACGGAGGAGPGNNASGPDAGQPAATGTGPTADAGTASGGFRTVNDCHLGEYVDQSGAAGGGQIAFGGPLGMHYSPRCLTIAAGETVTFTGQFGGHPFKSGASVGTDDGDAANPITDTGSGNIATFTFPTPGWYPYHCMVHASLGMYGTIQVK